MVERSDGSREVVGSSPSGPWIFFTALSAIRSYYLFVLIYLLTVYILYFMLNLPFPGIIYSTAFDNAVCVSSHIGSCDLKSSVNLQDLGRRNRSSDGRALGR